MAMTLNGSTQYYEAASAVLTAVPLTLAAWFNVANVTASHTLISLDTNGGADRFMLQADGATASDPVVAFTAQGGTTRQSVANGFTANVWHHGAAVFSATNNRLAYLNGTAGTAQTNTITPSGINRTNIGSRWATTRGSFCNGSIAEAAAWNVALTAAEIASLALGVKPSRIRPQSLVMYVPAIRSVIDIRAGLAFTASGSPTVGVHPRSIG